MNTIAPLDPKSAALAGASAQSPSVSVSQDAQVSVTRHQSLEVNMTTVEGDQFTFSENRMSAGVQGTYSELARFAWGATVAQSNIEASISASRVAMTLQGNLTSEEARDMAKALKEVIKVIRDMEAGHLKQAVHRAGKLAKLDTLAGIESTFESNTSAVSLEQQQLLMGEEEDATNTF